MLLPRTQRRYLYGSIFLIGIIVLAVWIAFSPIANPVANPVKAASAANLKFSSAAYSVNEGDGTATITVTRTGDSSGEVTIGYSITSGVAAWQADYFTISGRVSDTLIFAAGETSKTFSISIINDSIAEVNETIHLSLSTNITGNALLSTPSAAILTITDNDTIPDLSINDVTVIEKTTGINAVFTVKLSTASDNMVKVNYATANGTALVTSDYTAKSGTLTFPPGTISQTISVPVAVNTTVEPDETFFVNLTSPVNATIGDSQGVGTIKNDDGVSGLNLEFSSNVYSIKEGDSTSITIGVNKLGTTSSTVTVNYATSNGSAVSPGDYTAASGTLTFTSTTTIQNITITIPNDSKSESNETVNLVLSNPSSGATLGTQSTAVLEISDDDPLPRIYSRDVDVQESNTGVTNAVFTVSLSAAIDQALTVGYQTVSGTATEGINPGEGDYTSTSGTLTFPAGTTTQTISVPINGDSISEQQETFFIQLANQTNSVIADGLAKCTIINNDGATEPFPYVSIHDTYVLEGDSGTTTAQFTVTLSAPSSNSLTISYHTVNGLAVSPSDYTAIPTTQLTFAPGETSKTISVSIAGNTIAEADEYFSIFVTPAGNVLRVIGECFIINDDGETLPKIYITDASLKEGDSGTSNAVFTVNLSGPSSQSSTVGYKTANSSAIADTTDIDGNLTPGDYTGKSLTILTFAAGTVSQTINIAVRGDTEVEDAVEVFSIILSGPTNSVIAESDATCKIIDDDVSISINDITAAEVDEGSTDAIFTVSISPASLDEEVSVNYATANSGAAAGTDYIAKSGTLTFPPGVTTQTIAVQVNGDFIYEVNEIFVLNLSNPTNAIIADTQGKCTITNDDENLPNVTIVNTSKVEGNLDAQGNPVRTTVPVNVTLSRTSTQVITVNYATEDNSATAGSDYIAKAGTVTFPAGTTSQTIEVEILGDVTPETSEAFHVKLFNSTNANLATIRNTITITSDDTLPKLTISDASLKEGNTGTTNAVFTVSLDSTYTDQTITVNYATANTFATAGSDYTSQSGTLTFLPGMKVQNIIVPINGDAAVEPDETFKINLTNIVNAAFANNVGLGWIINDDAISNGASKLSISKDVFLMEGDNGTVNVIFRVTLDATFIVGLEQEVTVEYGTANRTALAGSAATGGDYVATSGTITFPIGTTQVQATQNISVTINSDTTVEPDETFYIYLKNATNAAITTPEVKADIITDDGIFIPSILISDAAAVTEGDAGTTVNTEFVVTLSAPSDLPVMVDVATDNGTAGSPGDFNTILPTTYIFQPGETSKTVVVTVKGDSSAEKDETFKVRLSNPIRGKISDSEAVCTILADDYRVNIDSIALFEGNSGTTPAVFTLTLFPYPRQVPVSVSYTTSEEAFMAVAGVDFVAQSGTVTFDPGQTSKTLTVNVMTDTIEEPDENFTILLSNGVNAVAGGPGTCGIYDDDKVLPVLTINDMQVNEGSAGVITNAIFTLTLSKPSDVDVTVTYLTGNDTAIAGTAAQGGDYISGSGTITIPAGTTSPTVRIFVNGDSNIEPDETFFLNLSNPTNAVIGDAQGKGTILNDDTDPISDFPTVSISDARVTEGSSTPLVANFTVSLSQANTSQAVTVTYATSNISATAGEDYVAKTGTLTFPSGTTQQTIAITINDDSTPESEESFSVTLSNETNATMGDGHGVGTILDNDSSTLPALSISDVSVTEKDAVDATGDVSAAFTVTLQANTQEVTVDFATADNTTTAGSDYVALTTSKLTFSPSTTSQTQTITVKVKGDTLVEGNETFFVRLSNPLNATISDGEGLGTIIDNESSVPGNSTLEFEQTSYIPVSEDSSSSFTINVLRSGDSSGSATVTFTLSGTAIITTDYTVTPTVAGSVGTLTFNSGDTIKSITITPVNNNAAECDKTVNITLSNPIGAALNNNKLTTVLPIADDETVKD